MKHKNHFIFTLLAIFIISIPNILPAQVAQTLYRTSSSYQPYQLDKVPFAMKKIAIIPAEDSVMVGDKLFIKTALKGGGFIYVTPDKKGYLLMNNKVKEKEVGFIVSPNGNDWSCYYQYYADSKKANSIPPEDDGASENEGLKDAITKIVDSREQQFHLAYSSYPTSMRGSGAFEAETLPVIFISEDSILANDRYFVKKAKSLYRCGNYNYLYLPDNETIIFRDQDASNWATFYKKDPTAANQLIAKEYTWEKELSSTNDAIANRENSKTAYIVNNYFGSLKTKRNDPAFATTILKNWNELYPLYPAYKIIFIDANFHTATNSSGVPLHKSIAAWVLYKHDGKCLAKWFEYGYQYMGGGTYSKELSQWVMNQNDYYISASSNQGSQRLFSADEFEIPCSL